MMSIMTASRNKGCRSSRSLISPNLTDGVFSRGDDRSLGWPAYLASVITDPENHDEVTGGKWSSGRRTSGQEFPSGFGADGLLFTDDDPEMSRPGGIFRHQSG